MDGYFTTASPVTIYQMVDENLQVYLYLSIEISKRFQDFFQGVAEIFSGGDENLSKGGEKIAHSPFL